MADSSATPLAAGRQAGDVGSALPSWERFREEGKRMVDEIADYYAKLASPDSSAVPVRSRTAPGYLLAALPSAAPEVPESFDAVLADVHRHIMPGVSHWQHPNWFAFFPAQSSPPALLGDMLSDALAVIGFSWVASPACTELETVVMDWLAQLIGLPPSFCSSAGKGGGGVIQGTASEATLCALLAAKARALGALRSAAPPAAGSDEAAWEAAAVARLTVYMSDQAHSSVKKAAMVAGIPLANVRVLPAPAGHEYALPAEALATAIAEDVSAGRVPFFAVATLGTTSSGAFDPVRDIGRAVQAYNRGASTHSSNPSSSSSSDTGAGAGASAVSGAGAAGAPTVPVWLHIDAAWAGAALICPELRPLMATTNKSTACAAAAAASDAAVVAADPAAAGAAASSAADSASAAAAAAAGLGLDLIDSLCFNPHKWLRTTFDCSAFWVGAGLAHWLVQALSLTPEYLRSAEHESGAVRDLRDWQVPLGRRFRSLKLWMTLRMYGAEELRRGIREHVHMGEVFESLVRSDARFEVPVQRSLSLVCFRLRGASDAAQEALLARLNDSGRLFMVHTKLAGVGVVLRMAIGGSLTREEHVRAAWDLIASEADAVLAAHAVPVGKGE